jgi:pimeloyl-ACP methyl ester carboxylesterase
MFNKLMIALGYSSYVAQGGDWGSVISRRLGQLYPDHCKAIHVNMLLTIGTPRFTQGPLIWLKWVTLIGPALLYDKREIKGLRNLELLRGAEMGYQV